MLKVLPVALLLLVAGAPPAGGDSADRGPALALGTAKLRLVIPSEDWAVYETRRRVDGSGVYHALSSAKRNMVFSFFLDSAAACRNAAACRDAALANPAFKDAKDLALSERGQFSVAQFSLDAPMHQPVKQTHVLAETIIGGIAVDIHLSRTAAVAPDAAALYEFLDVVSFE